MHCSVVVCIWNPIWLAVLFLWFFSVHKATYIYYAIICRVKYVVCAKPPTTHPTPTEDYKAEQQPTGGFAQATYLTIHIKSLVDISYFIYLLTYLHTYLITYLLTYSLHGAEPFLRS